eukprot:g79798.t1
MLVLLRGVPCQAAAPAAYTATRSYHHTQSLDLPLRSWYEVGPVPERKGCLEDDCGCVEDKHKHEVHKIEFQPADPWSHEERLEACMRAEAAMRLRDSNRLFVQFPADLSEYMKCSEGTLSIYGKSHGGCV